MSLERQKLLQFPPPPFNGIRNRLAIAAINFFWSVNALKVKGFSGYQIFITFVLAPKKKVRETMAYGAAPCHRHMNQLKGFFTFSIPCIMIKLLQCKATNDTNFVTITVMFHYT